MADDVGGVEHHLREASGLDRAKLALQRTGQGDGIHAEMVEIHGASCDTTSSKVTPPRYGCVSAPLSLGCTAPRSMKTMPRSFSARVAAAISGAPRPTRTRPSSQRISSAPGGGSMSCR